MNLLFMPVKRYLQLFIFDVFASYLDRAHCRAFQDWVSLRDTLGFSPEGIFSGLTKLSSLTWWMRSEPL